MEKKVYQLTVNREDPLFFSNLSKAYAYYTTVIPKDQQVSYSRIAEAMKKGGRYSQWATPQIHFFKHIVK